MSRRRFLQVAGAGVAGAAMGRAGRGAQAATGDPGDIFERLVRANDSRVPALLERQETAPYHPFRGALPDEHGIHSAGGAAGLVQTLVAALAAPGSRHRGSPEIGGRLALAARALLALQHADGTIDLPTTNFHSPPDTAFVLEPVVRGALRRPAGAARRASPGGRGPRAFRPRGGRGSGRGRDPHAEPPLGRLRRPRPPARALPRLPVRDARRPVAGRGDRHRRGRPVLRAEHLRLLADLRPRIPHGGAPPRPRRAPRPRAPQPGDDPPLPARRRRRGHRGLAAAGPVPARVARRLPPPLPLARPAGREPPLRGRGAAHRGEGRRRPRREPDPLPRRPDARGSRCRPTPHCPTTSRVSSPPRTSSASGEGR